MNAFITIVLCSIIALIAVPVIAFLYDAIPALIRSFAGWLEWITYKED